VARPLWLRLFGPNGPTTFAELREALLASPLGDRLGEGRLIQQLESILDRDPPTRGVTLPVLPAAGQQADVAAAMVLEHDLAAAPAPALDLAAPTPASAIDVARAAVEEILSVVAPAPQDATGGANLVGDNDGRRTSVFINGIVPTQVAGGPASPFARLDLASPYTLLGDIQTGLVIDNRNKTLMQGGPGDYPEMFAGANDTLELDGDYSAGFDFTVPSYIEQVIFHAGNDYNLIASDDAVAAGGLLTVNAMPLKDDNHVLFDGSAEKDGAYLFFGSDAGDMFIGGAGDDRIYGFGGADVLSGGGGRDTFVYYDAAHSSGADYDVIADFDPTADKIDLEVTVSGFDAAIAGGTLSTGSFDTDLAAALSGLGAGKAALYAPDAGDLAGTVFLIVDANGVAGYQEGEDYVFALAGSTLEDLSGQTGFFI